MDNIENDVVTYLTNKINLKKGFRIIWLRGLGDDGSGLLGLLERVTIKAVSNIIKPRYTIRVSMPSIVDQMTRFEKTITARKKISYELTSNEAVFEMETYIAIAIANALGIMDANEKVKKLKDELDEELLYNYEVNKLKESNLVDELLVEIYEKLRNTSYLLVIECIDIDQSDGAVLERAMKWLLKEGWLPEPSKWNGALWVISSPEQIRLHFNLYEWGDHHLSMHFFTREFYDVLTSITGKDERDVFFYLKGLIREKYWPLQSKQQLVELALLYCAQSVAPALATTSSRVRVRETMDILRSCLLYSLLLSPEINDNISRYIPSQHGIRSSTFKELYSRLLIGHKADLVNFWVAEGLFTPKISTMARLGDEEEGESREINLTDSLNAANMVFEAFHSNSLIQFLIYWNFNMERTRPMEISFVELFLDYPSVPFIGMRELLETSLGAQKDISSPIDWENKSWISFLGDDGKWIIHPKTNKTTTFLYRANSTTSQSTINTVLMKMSHLRVLDLSYSSFDALPTSIANLTNLRLLSLKGCKNIRTLRPSELDSSHSTLTSTSLVPEFSGTKLGSKQDHYSPIVMLKKLAVLNLNGVPLTQVPEEIGRKKHCLYFLDLSCPTITSLPHNLFLEMSSLRELFLLGCTSLKSLPTSLATLIHLEIFSLSHSLVDSLPCSTFEQMQRLRVLRLIGNNSLMHLPNSLSRASMLQELHIHDCSALREVKVAGHSRLETIALSGLNNLMELDLSFTSIKEFPLEVCNQDSLRRLDLISVCQLKRIPWHELRKPLPEVFNLVSHEYKVMGNQGLVVQDTVEESLQLLKDGIGMKIFVRDSRLLSTFKSELILDNQGAIPRTFYICVSEHRNLSMSRDMTSNNQFHKKNPYSQEGVHLFQYKFVQHFVESHLCRQVEICSVRRSPSGLQVILSFTESLLVRDDAFVSSLTDLNPEFPELQECKLEGCHLMEVVFRETNRPKGKKLQNLWVSNLLNLTNVLHGSFQFDEFWALKCVNLRDCPRLVSIFPGNLKLPCLETLSIVRCYDLRSLFYYCQANDKDQFPRLCSIKLHQLPQLSQLYDCQKHPFQMPEWKELKFRGCWSLNRLPLLTRPLDQKVFVDGDIRQCKMFLSEMDKNQLCCYHFKSQPPVTSFKERVMNRIFLK